MADTNGDWGRLLSQLAVLEGESDDSDEESTESEESDEDGDTEFDPITLGLGALAARQFGVGGRRPVHRAKTTGNYAQSVRGKGEGVVQTPSGPARIALPGNFPTVEEFRKTVGEIQKDMKANSTGIKELGDQQRKDVLRLTETITKNEKRLRKRLRSTEIRSLLYALMVPVIKDLWPRLRRAI